MSTEEIVNLKDRIEDFKSQKEVAEQQLRILTGQLEDAELEYEVQTNPEILVAEELHRIKCKADHPKGCGWYYESWDKPGYARDEYLDEASELLANDVQDNPKDVLRILRLVK